MTSLKDFFHFQDVSLTKIQDNDLEPTVVLINSAYAYQDKYKGKPRTDMEHLRQRVGESEFFVAKQENEIVGCVYVEALGASVHFGLLMVIKKLRGQGLGTALINAIEAYAKALGAKKVELDYMSVAPWLKHYYERYGYTETGTVINWGTIDLIHMAKTLN